MASTRSAQVLIQAALDLIASRGVESLTLSQVAAHAGVSRATAYREFRDKDGLLSALARHEIALMSSATMEHLDLQADPATSVPLIVRGALRYLRNHAAFTYVRDHEPHWLLRAALVVGDTRLNLVQTVAATVAPALSHRDYPQRLLPPLQAAEVIVRTVLSHALMEPSALTDDQVAQAVTRAISPSDAPPDPADPTVGG